MKIKITSCSDCLFWYNDYIQEIFLVHRTEEDRYWVRERNAYGCLNFVLKKDCEIYKEED